jgi:hypothetical protein
MKRLWFGILWLGGLGLGQSVSAQTAAQKVEKQLAELLAPGGSIAPVTFAVRPVVWKGSKAVEEIPSAMHPYVGLPPRLPQVSGKSEPRPRVSVGPDETPLASYQEPLKGPKGGNLPEQPLIRLQSVDIHRPLPIPILAQPQKDRASLGDPALQASVDAALRQFTLVRDRPLPFVALNLPDPFEHIRWGQLLNPPEENPMPPVIPLRKPGK